MDVRCARRLPLARKRASAVKRAVNIPEVEAWEDLDPDVVIAEERTAVPSDQEKRNIARRKIEERKDECLPSWFQ